MDQNTVQIYVDGPPWICGQQNVSTTARDSTVQSTDKLHTGPRLEIKIPDQAGNRTMAAGLESSNSNYHITDVTFITIWKITRAINGIHSFSISIIMLWILWINVI